jgi:hypothetical protein
MPVLHQGVGVCKPFSSQLFVAEDTEQSTAIEARIQTKATLTTTAENLSPQKPRRPALGQCPEYQS